MEGQVSDTIQRLSEIGRIASSIGEDENRRFRYHVRLWQVIKEEKMKELRAISFANFHSIMLALTNKPQRIQTIVDNCNGVWSYVTVSRTLRVLNLLGMIKRSHDLKNTRFVVYWIDEEEPLGKDTGR